MTSSFVGARLPFPGRRASARWRELLRPRKPSDPVRAYATLAVLTVLALLVLAGIIWRSWGGSWAIVETPSMGRSVPVGTLIFTRETPLRQLQVGDVVSYHPPNTPAQTFTHRVVHKYRDGSLQVRGDINGAADPLPVRQVDLVGKVVAQWYAIGWLIRALPLLIVGVMVIMVATAAFVRARWRSSARIMALCLLLSLSALILRPFVRPVLIDVSTDDPSGPVAHVVSSGLMPTRVTGAASHFVDLTNGQVGSVPVRAVDPGHPFQVNGHPHLDLAWLLLVIVVCSLPLLWCLIVGLSPEDES